ncbi:hypothetical protein PUN28_017595 [Cardiocondyla obscurior]|uniref:Uncharacterized protein n=1 Tax=Cardiocondyla obscurior TaxID=286306 RepID=A0AAW2EKY2_9HYME
MDECMLAISFFLFSLAIFSPFFSLLKERHNLSRFNNLQFNLQSTCRHASASPFLQLSKVFLARSMSGPVAENTYTFMLMNTKRTYVRHTYRVSCHCNTAPRKYCTSTDYSRCDNLCEGSTTSDLERCNSFVTSAYVPKKKSCENLICNLYRFKHVQLFIMDVELFGPGLSKSIPCLKTIKNIYKAEQNLYRRFTNTFDVTCLLYRCGNKPREKQDCKVFCKMVLPKESLLTYPAFIRLHARMPHLKKISKFNKPDPRMALFSVPIIFRSLHTFSALPSLAARQTLVLMSGESCLIYELATTPSGFETSTRGPRLPFARLNTTSTRPSGSQRFSQANRERIANLTASLSLSLSLFFSRRRRCTRLISLCRTCALEQRARMCLRRRASPTPRERGATVRSVTQSWEDYGIETPGGKAQCQSALHFVPVSTESVTRDVVFAAFPRKVSGGLPRRARRRGRGKAVKKMIGNDSIGGEKGPRGGRRPATADWRTKKQTGHLSLSLAPSVVAAHASPPTLLFSFLSSRLSLSLLSGSPSLPHPARANKT